MNNKNRFNASGSCVRVTRLFPLAAPPARWLALPLAWSLAASASASASAPAAAQAPSSASLRQTMSDRAQRCAAALAIEASRHGERVGAAHNDASRRYTSLAMMMAPGAVSPASIVQSLDREGMSRGRVRDLAQSCKEQLEQNRLQFSLDAVPGFPANDLLRARLCVAALNAAVGMLNPATEAPMIRDLQRARGSLNLYYVERSRAMGIPARADDGSREPFRSPSSGSGRPTGDEVAGCVVAGRQALAMITEPR